MGKSRREGAAPVGPRNHCKDFGFYPTGSKKHRKVQAEWPCLSGYCFETEGGRAKQKQMVHSEAGAITQGGGSVDANTDSTLLS